MFAARSPILRNTNRGTETKARQLAGFLVEVYEVEQFGVPSSHPSTTVSWPPSEHVKLMGELRGALNELADEGSMKGLTLLTAILALTLLSAWVDSKEIYTLYRTSFGVGRVHIATFDAADRKGFNQINCEIARKLFASQPGVTQRFWCERGRFQP
jgi:hypothetical protein